jgi:hypothetical protein
MKKLLLLSFTSFISIVCISQTRLLTYPFEFDKTFTTRNDSYFLEDPTSSTFSFVLRNNGEVQYVQLDKNFNILAKFDVPAKNTVFEKGLQEYFGGTSSNGIFHYVYKISTRKIIGFGKPVTEKYFIENVDFVKKTVTSSELFDLQKDEDLLISFSEANKYYSIAVNDKTNELIIYGIDDKGKAFTKNCAFPLQEYGTKSHTLSEYLHGIKLIKVNEEVGVETTSSHSKLFSFADKLVFVINRFDNPTHIVTLNTTTNFKPIQKFVKHAPLVLDLDSKDDVYCSSYIFNDIVASLYTSKKRTKIALYSLLTNKLLKQYEICESCPFSEFALAPTRVERRGKKIDESLVENPKKIVKEFYKGAEGLAVRKTKEGNLVITAGTFDFLPVGNGFSSSSYQTSIGSPISAGSGNSTQLSGTNMFVSYVPGHPTTTSGIANFYKSTYFKLLLDPVSFNTVKGDAGKSETEQIKNYIDEVSKKARATNQFSMDGKQFYAYYEKDLKAYVVDEILIK